MKVIVKKNENGVSVISVVNDDEILEINKSTKGFIVDSDYLPSEPQETWILSDEGIISVNQEKLVQIKREQMPILAPMDFEFKLIDNGLYEKVQVLIETDLKLKVAYNRAAYFSRLDSFIEQARIALKLTHEQLDEMWTS